MFTAKSQIGITLLSLIVSAMFALQAVTASTATSASSPAQPVALPTPVPVVVGPLPVSAASYPFGASDHTMIPEDLSEVAYVEEEYLVSGLANVYSWPAPGPAIVRTAGARR